MIFTIEGFILYNILMATVSWYLSKWQGKKEYDMGFMDAVQLHSEGRLTYTVEQEDDGINLITIEVKE